MISPFFTSLTKRYTPIVCPRCPRKSFQKTNSDIMSFKKSVGNKTVVFTESEEYFSNLELGALTRYNNERIYFNMSTLKLSDCVVHPYEFMPMLRGCMDVHCERTTFSTPVLYSELWPRLRRGMTLYLDIQNLIYDDKMPQMLAQMPQNTPKAWKLYNMSLSKDVVVPIAEKFINSPVGHHVHMVFQPDNSNINCAWMANIVVKMILDARYLIDKNHCSGTGERILLIEKVSDKKIRLLSRDL
uniref:ULP_PROTEASE domain-containing protein n=1 Tax=Panagrellus redivivus TaxID=6233 RepID=A0A7E4VJ38_PANRE